MLFNSTEIEKREPSTPLSNPAAMRIEVKNQFLLGKHGDALRQLITSINPGTAIHLPSFGNWSFHHMIMHVLDLVGPAKVWLCSWTISEQPVKELLHLMDSGIIIELRCLFDSRVPKQCPNAYQIAQHRFANLKLCHIHAKIAVIQTPIYSITINSSANLSRNDAIESYVLTECRELALFNSKWINEQINEGFPFSK